MNILENWTKLINADAIMRQHLLVLDLTNIYEDDVCVEMWAKNLYEKFVTFR